MATKNSNGNSSSNGAGVDAWQQLVLRSMSVDELQRESVNEDNSASERAAMVDELKRRLLNRDAAMRGRRS
jgi:hypothetical protein